MIKNIIIQAGGRGSRLERFTDNKPKALLPVDNLPMLFHAFKKFRDYKFVIIADYKADVLEKYLSTFADVEYDIVETHEKGTCSGIKTAINNIPEREPFVLMWSDLILNNEFMIPKEVDDYVGISESFECRWSYSNNIFEERRSKNDGVAGFFIFKDKSKFIDIPNSGEFVRWLKDKNFEFKRISLRGTKEFGVLDEYLKYEAKNNEAKCRPFNKLEIDEGTVTKIPANEYGEKISKDEINWYKKIEEDNVDFIPKIYSYNPLRMQKINGDHIFNYDISELEKRKVLENVVQCLKKLHSLKNKIEVDCVSVMDTYLNKTFERLDKIRELVPFADQENIIINGTNCKNIFFNKDKLKEKIESIFPKEFSFIHGDCTFSNMLMNKEKNIYLIDPRGYFGNTKLYGDEDYDWAKLYYSICGDYDKFNRKRFFLRINKDCIDIEIESNGWKEQEEYFFNLIGNEKQEKIKLLHAIIWLSLTTYAWEDYDSICVAFYNGLLHMEGII